MATGSSAKAQPAGGTRWPSHRERREAQHWARLSRERLVWKQAARLQELESLYNATPETTRRLAFVAPVLNAQLSDQDIEHPKILRRNVASHARRLPAPGAPDASWRKARRGPRLSRPSNPHRVSSKLRAEADVFVPLEHGAIQPQYGHEEQHQQRQYSPGVAYPSAHCLRRTAEEAARAATARRNNAELFETKERQGRHHNTFEAEASTANGQASSTEDDDQEAYGNQQSTERNQGRHQNTFVAGVSTANGQAGSTEDGDQEANGNQQRTQRNQGRHLNIFEAEASTENGQASPTEDHDQEANGNQPRTKTEAEDGSNDAQDACGDQLHTAERQGRRQNTFEAKVRTANGKASSFEDGAQEAYGNQQSTERNHGRHQNTFEAEVSTANGQAGSAKDDDQKVNGEQLRTERGQGRRQNTVEAEASNGGAQEDPARWGAAQTTPNCPEREKKKRRRRRAKRGNDEETTGAASTWESGLIPPSARRPLTVFEDDLEDGLEGDLEDNLATSEHQAILRARLTLVQVMGAPAAFAALPTDLQTSFAEASITELSAYVGFQRWHSREGGDARRAAAAKAWASLDGDDTAEWVPDNPSAVLAADTMWAPLLQLDQNEAHGQRETDHRRREQLHDDSCYENARPQDDSHGEHSDGRHKTSTPPRGEAVGPRARPTLAGRGVRPKFANDQFGQHFDNDL
ncbi:unnamed protein product [Prorocentrum cordatum]|uniref:Uncharacterized protein n=1 Tax=Prorocentrum cordatum TaxID=2364126 RepID=A0ABN9XLQ2_9DINO|nr:unnamed protein product [Polarella glacialis]